MKRSLKCIVLLLLAMSILFSMIGCSQQETSADDASQPESSATESNTGNSGDVFRIGLSTSFTGSTAQEGIEARNAAEMAIAYVNDNGGFNGKEGVLATTYDNKGSPEEAAKAARKLVENEEVHAVIGSSISAEMLASGQIFEDAQIFTVGMGTSPTWMNQGWKYIIRGSVNYDFVGEETAKMVTEMGITEIAIMKDQQEAALTFINAFKESVGDSVTIVAEESCEVDDTDLSSQCARIVASKPQAILMSTTSSDAGYFVKQIRQNGYTGLIFDKESYYTTYAEISGWDYADYILFASPYVTYNDISECDIDIMHDFLERYQEAYGVLPKTEVPYRVWDSIMVVAEAANLAKSTDSDDMLAVVPQIKIEGLGGTMDYSNGDGEPYHNVNRFVLIDQVNSSWTKWYNDGGYDDYKASTGNAY